MWTYYKSSGLPLDVQLAARSPLVCYEILRELKLHSFICVLNKLDYLL